MVKAGGVPSLARKFAFGTETIHREQVAGFEFIIQRRWWSRGARLEETWVVLRAVHDLTTGPLPDDERDWALVATCATEATARRKIEDICQPQTSYIE